jgi:NAD(P)-dependent dehydrogenase (short-subunit alcohol dehydrogenase family)
MKKLDGKVAIVTGATKGIGRVIAARLAEEGAKVVICGRTAKRGEEVVAAIRNAGGEARYVQADIGREEDIKAVIRDAVDAYGRLTTLVNNAASTDLINRVDGMVGEISLDAWESILRVTLTGTMLMSKYALPAMAEAGGGSIVHISSDASQRPPPEMAAYAAAKAAVNSLSRSIAVEYGHLGIRSNTIINGMILPPQSLPLFEADRDLWARLHGQHLVPRLGRREDTAGAVVYFASDDSAFLTGTELPVDGGSRIMTNILGKDDIFQNKS